MSDIKINEVLERFSKAINYFIEHEANEHENKFFDNVNELINVKADMYKANESNQTAEPVLNICDVSQQSELLVSFLRWYINDEMFRKEPDRVTNIVDRFLKETNCG